MSFLKKLFKVKDDIPAINRETIPTIKMDTTLAGYKDLKSFLTEEIERSPYIKSDKKNIVIKHGLNEIDLFKGEELSLEEKKVLNLNTRAKITKQVFEVLTKTGLENYKNLRKNPIFSIVVSANNKHLIYYKLVKMRSIQITNEFKVSNVGDERDCAWCRKVNKKRFPIDTDYIKLINDNCTCEYHRGSVSAYINFAKY